MNDRGMNGDWDAASEWQSTPSQMPQYEGPSHHDSGWETDTSAYQWGDTPGTNFAAAGQHPFHQNSFNGENAYTASSYSSPTEYGSGSRSGASRIAAVTALFLAIIAVVAVGTFLVVNNRSDNSPPIAVPAPTDSSSQESPTATNSATSVSSAEPTTPQSTSASSSPTPSSSRSTPSTTSTSSSVADPALPPGLTIHGWEGKIGCNANDEWIYAGGNGSDYAVICVATPSAGLYYRGLFRGGIAEHDLADWEESVGYFETMPDGGTYIVISGDQLTVYDADSAVLAETTFTTTRQR